MPQRNLRTLVTGAYFMTCVLWASCTGADGSWALRPGDFLSLSERNHAMVRPLINHEIPGCLLDKHAVACRHVAQRQMSEPRSASERRPVFTRAQPKCPSQTRTALVIEIELRLDIPKARQLHLSRARTFCD